VPAGQQVEVDDHEQIVERVAAIDVAKASGMVCTRVPHPDVAGKRVTTVWQVGAATNQILELAEQLAGQGIQRVVVESTSDYWRPLVYLLEARGLVVWLVNAHQVKHLPGRPKTDKLDAVWLAKPQRAGHAAALVRPTGRDPPAAGRPPAARRPDPRALPPHPAAGKGCRVDALIKLSSVATDIFGVSGRAMLEALVAGQRDPEALAGLARGRLRVKHAALVAALTGRFDAHHAFVARMLLDQIDALGGQIERLTTRIEQAIAAIPAASPPAPDPGGGHGAAAGDAIGPARSLPGHIERVDPQTGEILAAALPVVDRRDEVAGIGRLAAQVIIAKVGLDMAQFPTPWQLVSWARLSPRTIQSGATRRAGATGHGNPYLKAALGEAATAAAKTNTFLGERYRRLVVKRIGKLKALVAIARSILIIVWHLLTDPTARFHDLGADYYASRIDTTRKTRNLVRQLEALGHKVTLQPAA
jgi:transposase